MPIHSENFQGLTIDALYFWMRSSSTLSRAIVGDKPKLDTKDEDVLEKDPDGEPGVTELAYLAHPPSVRDGNDPDDVDHDTEAVDGNEGEGEREDEDEAVGEHVHPSNPSSLITQQLILVAHHSTPDAISAPGVEGTLQLIVDYTLSESEGEREVEAAALMMHPMGTYRRASLMWKASPHLANDSSKPLKTSYPLACPRSPARKSRLYLSTVDHSAPLVDFPLKARECVINMNQNGVGLAT
ncbi:hypothetical protein V5O48_011730 [Marasmius crinis-equi]|uniref:Uncharacterized protein n=1 Tax=Marasmius crinis-equi TaxID=585013 RepID=A0ABR3F4R7_9AGAR